MQAVTPAAIGLRSHSGWAALVAVAGPARAPVVVDRRRLVTADPGIRGSKQPYHAAERSNLVEARELVGRCLQSSRRLAHQEIGRTVDDLTRRGFRVVGCGVLRASGRELPGLAGILASHALIHAAEGEMFRDILCRAALRRRVPVTGLRERGLLEDAATRLRMPGQGLARRLTEMGRSFGAPWTQDQKLAALCAWLVLISS